METKMMKKKTELKRKNSIILVLLCGHPLRKWMGNVCLLQLCLFNKKKKKEEEEEWMFRQWMKLRPAPSSRSSAEQCLSRVSQPVGSHRLLRTPLLEYWLTYLALLPFTGRASAWASHAHVLTQNYEWKYAVAVGWAMARPRLVQSQFIHILCDTVIKSAKKRWNRGSWLWTRGARGYLYAREWIHVTMCDTTDWLDRIW